MQNTNVKPRANRDRASRLLDQDAWRVAQRIPKCRGIQRVEILPGDDRGAERVERLLRRPDGPRRRPTIRMIDRFRMRIGVATNDAPPAWDAPRMQATDRPMRGVGPA